MKKIFVVLVAFVATVMGCQSQWLENIKDDYFAPIIESGIVFDNSQDEAIAQTKVYDYVLEHFQTPNEEGKAKKALTIFLDGTRADALINLVDLPRSSILENAAKGGLYLGYCGGKDDYLQNF